MKKKMKKNKKKIEFNPCQRILKGRPNEAIFRLICLISIIGSLIRLFVLFSCSKTKSVNDFAKEYADSQEWFDYSYEVVENFDEDNLKRYHITYYISGNNKQEIIGYIRNNEFIYEVIE